MLLSGRDTATVLQLSEKLYGREVELKALMGCYNRVCEHIHFITSIPFRVLLLLLLLIFFIYRWYQQGEQKWQQSPVLVVLVNRV